MFAVSCAEKPKPLAAPQLIYVYPPAALLQQCEQTPFTGETFGDAVMALQVAQNELDVCASRIEGLIKWQRDNSGNGWAGLVQPPAATR
ncbi:Rz1-like lysis system protein LysC [Serratia oryzae]|uniref:Rz1-like lysis system protein LysC n=1 Tax=Serratia oryzae TaxID=2034155 RepID=UPI003BAC32A1